MSAPAPPLDRPRGSALAIAALLLGVALAMRCFAVTRDLFVDEIRSLFFADWARSLLAVFSIQHDNNHLLNTLWLHLAGPGQSAGLYRLPALLAGFGSLGVGAALALRRSRDEALILLALLGTSNLVVHYSTEARGYSFAILAQLLAFYALERGLEDRRKAWHWSLLFQASIVLGLLAHLSFAVAYVALGTYQIAHFAWGSQGFSLRSVPLKEIAAWNAFPSLFAAALWFFFARGMQIGGAPDTDTLTEILGTAANSIGFASSGSDLWIGAGIAVLIAGVALVALARERDPHFALYVTGLLIAPALALAVRPTSFVQPRYFLPSVLFFLLLSASFAAALLRSGPRGRALVIAAVAIFMVANIMLTLPLWRDGQGEYGRGMALMAQESQGDEITLGSGRPAHDQIVFEFYARELPPDRALRFVTARDWPSGGPKWLALLPPPEAEIRKTVRDEHGNTYRLRETFSASPRSGGAWLLYRND